MGTLGAIFVVLGLLAFFGLLFLWALPLQRKNEREYNGAHGRL